MGVCFVANWICAGDTFIHIYTRELTGMGDFADWDCDYLVGINEEGKPEKVW